MDSDLIEGHDVPTFDRQLMAVLNKRSWDADPGEPKVPVGCLNSYGTVYRVIWIAGAAQLVELFEVVSGLGLRADFNSQSNPESCATVIYSPHETRSKGSGVFP